MSKSQQSNSSVFSRLFNRQKEKVRAKETVSDVLRQFADDDLKKIAVVLNEWLKADDKQRAQAAPGDNVRRLKGK